MSIKGVKRYINRVFNDSFASVNSVITKGDTIDYILIKNKNNGIWQLYPFIHTRNTVAHNKIVHRLSNNVEKHFGVKYGDSKELQCTFNLHGRIDYDHTEMMFRYLNRTNLSLAIYDKDDNPSRVSDLVMNFANFYKVSIDDLIINNHKYSLPYEYQYDWELYKKLYEYTFDHKLGKSYEVIHSDGIKRIK